MLSPTFLREFNFGYVHPFHRGKKLSPAGDVKLLFTRIFELMLARSMDRFVEATVSSSETLEDSRFDFMRSAKCSNIAQVYKQRKYYCKRHFCWFSPARKCWILAKGCQRMDEESFHCLNSTPDQTSPENAETVSLRSEIKKLQEREQELERRFLGYCDLKEHEALLVKLQNVLMLEMVETRFLGREISSLQAQRQMLENLGKAFLRVVEQLGLSRTENLLHMRVKKLSRKMRKKCQIM